MIGSCSFFHWDSVEGSENESLLARVMNERIACFKTSRILATWMGHMTTKISCVHARVQLKFYQLVVDLVSERADAKLSF